MQITNSFGEKLGQGEYDFIRFTSLTFEEEEKIIIKKILLVGLWYIQIDPLKRPSMSKVVKMLQGQLKSIPYL
ncbi:hypothetical protein Ahy_B04g072346 [Arachis hypogaea]|uniref:Uncharacterized protein n=1 Tax=Arachis hypogaea TaxID=3818 RepID=A0A444ZN43_ARAHY|nr:hypothetical protein Ahy_B04g072346 [Arachis hypogaea]